MRLLSKRRNERRARPHAARRVREPRGHRGCATPARADMHQKRLLECAAECSFSTGLSRKSVEISRWIRSGIGTRGGAAAAAGRPSGRLAGEVVVVELEQVVG